jgi:pimeloyl-ACP methyl ester carboxylesterase
MATLAKREREVTTRLGEHWRWSVIRAAFGVISAVSPSLAGCLAFSQMIKPRRRQQRRMIRAQGLRISRMDHHERELHGYAWEGKKRVLLVHGWDADSTDFATLIPRLQRAGWGGLAYDAPAHGKSDGVRTDFLDMGIALRGILERYGPFEAVLGHSFGAAVAMYQLSQLNGQTPPLVISGGAPTSLIQVFEIYFERLRLSQAVRQDLYWRIEHRLGQPAGEISVTRAVRGLDSELLVIHDRMDPLIPFETAKKLTEAAPNARFLPTKGLGHRGWLRDGSVHDRILRFLEREKKRD